MTNLHVSSAGSRFRSRAAGEGLSSMLEPGAKTGCKKFRLTRPYTHCFKMTGGYKILKTLLLVYGLFHAGNSQSTTTPEEIGANFCASNFPGTDNLSYVDQPDAGVGPYVSRWRCCVMVRPIVSEEKMKEMAIRSTVSNVSLL